MQNDEGAPFCLKNYSKFIIFDEIYQFFIKYELPKQRNSFQVYDTLELSLLHYQQNRTSSFFSSAYLLMQGRFT